MMNSRTKGFIFFGGGVDPSKRGSNPRALLDRNRMVFPFETEGSNRFFPSDPNEGLSSIESQPLPLEQSHPNPPANIRKGRSMVFLVGSYRHEFLLFFFSFLPSSNASGQLRGRPKHLTSICKEQTILGIEITWFETEPFVSFDPMYVVDPIGKGWVRLLVHVSILVSFSSTSTRSSSKRGSW